MSIVDHVANGRRAAEIRWGRERARRGDDAPRFMKGDIVSFNDMVARVILEEKHHYFIKVLAVGGHQYNGNYYTVIDPERAENWRKRG